MPSCRKCGITLDYGSSNANKCAVSVLVQYAMHLHVVPHAAHLSYAALIDVPTNFCSLVHQFLPWRPARRRHSDHIHAAMHAIQLKHLSGILLPSVLPLCKYYLHVLSLSDFCILQCTPVLIL